MTATLPGRRFAAALAAAFLLPPPTAAWAAAAPIYKCLDRSLGVLYTDIPCKDGEQLDVRAGDADPAAVAQLAREREALDRSAAQRIADERRAALQRRYYDPGPANWVPDGGAYAEAPADVPYAYGYAFGGVYAPRHSRMQDRRRDRLDRPPEQARAVPARPAVPRR
jgi:hypothetical protein